MMRIVKEPDIRKQEILDGAIHVFAKMGYDQATISCIAKELKISQGLCYRYFASKEEIYYAAVEKYAELIVQDCLNNRNVEKHIRQWIEDIAVNIAALEAAEGRDENLYRIFHDSKNERLHNDLILKVAAKMLPYIQDTIRRAKDRGEICIEDPDGIAVLGLYGEVGLILTKELTAEERLHTIRTGWLRLLNLD